MTKATSGIECIPDATSVTNSLIIGDEVSFKFLFFNKTSENIYLIVEGIVADRRLGFRGQHPVRLSHVISSSINRGWCNSFYDGFRYAWYIHVTWLVSCCISGAGLACIACLRGHVTRFWRDILSLILNTRPLLVCKSMRHDVCYCFAFLRLFARFCIMWFIFEVE